MLNKDQMDVCKYLLRKSYEFTSNRNVFTYNWERMAIFLGIISIMTKSFDVEDAKELDEYINTVLIPIVCPVEGEFIGYKKCFTKNTYNDCIVKLLIPEDAKRSSAYTNKCRCSKAKVLDIISLKTNRHIKTAISSADNNFVYRVGETVQVDNFDENRFNECSRGIHFFMTEEEARSYRL